MIPKKNPTKWNSNDLYKFYLHLYKKRYGEDFIPPGYLGNIKSHFKELKDNYDIFAILVAMQDYVAFNTGSKYPIGITVDEASKRWNPEIQWYIRTRGIVPKSIKQMANKCILLHASWMMTAKQKQQLEELEEQLMKWVNE